MKKYIHHIDQYHNWTNNQDVRVVEFFSDHVETKNKTGYVSARSTNNDIKLYIRYKDYKENKLYLMQFRDADHFKSIFNIELADITPEQVKHFVINEPMVVRGVLLPLLVDRWKINTEPSIILYRKNKLYKCEDLHTVSYLIGFNECLATGLVSGAFKRVNGWTCFIKTSNKKIIFENLGGIRKEISNWYIKYKKYNVISLSSGYKYNIDTKLIEPVGRKYKIRKDKGCKRGKYNVIKKIIPTDTRQCLHCTNDFTVKYTSNHKFCSQSCSTKYNSGRKKGKYKTKKKGTK